MKQTENKITLCNKAILFIELHSFPTPVGLLLQSECSDLKLKIINVHQLWNMKIWPKLRLK